MLTFKQFLTERASPEFLGSVKDLLKFVTDRFPVEEITSYRGKYYDNSGFYQIRFKPQEGKIIPPDMMEQLAAAMQKAEGRKLGFKDVKENASTGNSGKYKGTSFTFKGLQYEYVLGVGGNKGEKFEKELLKAMQDYIAGEFNQLAQDAFDALSELNEDYGPDNIETVKGRTGSTHRSTVAGTDIGKIIADIILHTKDGDDIYVSVKDPNGKTIGQFGLEDAFNEDFTVNTKSRGYIDNLKPFNLNLKKVKEGLDAYESGTDIGPATVTSGIKFDATALQSLLARIWGTGYVYLRKKGSKFVAADITEEFLDDELLDSLKITEIRYPNNVRKQVSIFVESSTTKYKIDIRNAKGGVVPAQVQLLLLSSTSDILK